MAPRLPLRSWAHLHGAPTLLRARTEHAFLLSRSTKRGIKYGWSTLPRRSPRPAIYNEQVPNLPPPTFGPAAAQKRRENTTPVRTGLLATKKGMTSFYTRKGTRIPATVLQLDAVQVVATKTWARDRYWAVQVGCGVRTAARTTAPQLGYYEARGVAPKQHLVEFRVRGEAGLLPVGSHLHPDWFHVGQWVDVRSNTRGMGFEGGMKRHGFKGQPASHGNSKTHRAIGSTGPSQGGGSRVHPGKKMPGNMGGQRVTVQNLSVLQVDNELGIILVKGPIGGPKGCLVQIQDAVKKPVPDKAFLETTVNLVAERSPDAEERFADARKRHMELKEMRKQGIIHLAFKGQQRRGVAELLAAGATATTTPPERPEASA